MDDQDDYTLYSIQRSNLQSWQVQRNPQVWRRLSFCHWTWFWEWIFRRCEKSHFPLRGVRKPLVRPKVAHCYLSKGVFTVQCSVSLQTSIKAQPCLRDEGCGWPLVLNGHKGKDEGWMGLKTVPSPCIEERGGPWSAGKIQITKRFLPEVVFFFPPARQHWESRNGEEKRLLGKVSTIRPSREPKR